MTSMTCQNCLQPVYNCWCKAKGEDTVQRTCWECPDCGETRDGQPHKCPAVVPADEPTGGFDTFNTGAQRNNASGRGHPSLIRYTFLNRLAKVMEAGAKDHAPRNWEKGMPLMRTYDSAFRHLTAWLEERRVPGKVCGKITDDHLAQCAFNLMALMVFEEGLEDGTYDPDLIDDVQS